ncbi:MAG TPA: hypothetical protein VGB02_04085 [Pyrinomonadaceae bacterium]
MSRKTKRGQMINNLLWILNLSGLLLIVFAVFRFMSDLETGVSLLFLGIVLFCAGEIGRRIWRK